MYDNCLGQLGIPERLCITLGSICRKIFRFESPFDVLDPKEQEASFKREFTRGLSFIHWFSDPIDIRSKAILEIGCGYGGMLVALLQEDATKTIGLDLDHKALSFSKKKFEKQPNILLLEADAQEIPLPSSSVDVVVSDAVFEHIPDIHRMLREVARILRPNGRLYTAFGPTWLSYNGPHLIKCISIPWVQLFFSDKTILNVLTYYKQKGTFPRSYLEEKIVDFQRMGRLTLKKWHRVAKASGLEIIQELNFSPRPIKRKLARLPVLNELLAGDIRVVLEKPSLT